MPHPNPMKKQTWLFAMLSMVFATAATAQPALQTLITGGLNEPYGVAVDSRNNHYLTDSAHNRIVKYDPASGTVTNFAGVAGSAGSNDGLSVFARFFSPQGIVVARGGVVVADSGNHRIRLIADGSVSTLAGGTLGNQDGAGAAARFNGPAGLAADVAGNLYVADLVNNRIRKIDLANNVTTLPGTFRRPEGVTIDNATGTIYVADTGTHSIRAIAPNGTVTLLAGSGSQFISGRRDDLIATNALFSSPRGLLWVGGKVGLLVSDTGNGLVRRVYFNAALNTYSVETYLNQTLTAPIGLAVDNIGNFPVVDLGSHRLLNIQVTAPQAPVQDPQVGIVILSTNTFGQLRTELVPVVNSTFNNDVAVAILAERGTDTFFTLDPDANFPEDPGSRSTPQPYENGLIDWPFTIVNPAIDGSNVIVRAISTQDGRRSSKIVTARFQFKVANPVINGKNPGNFTLDVATEGAQLWYTTDGSAPVDASPSRLYTPGSRLNIVNGTNDVVFKVRAFKAGYAASAEIEKTFLYADLQNSSIGVTRDFNAGIGSTIVVPIDVKVASGDVLRSLQFRVEVTPVGAALPISSEFRYLHITTNDFVSLPIASSDEPLVSPSYLEGNTRGLAISFIGNTDLFPLPDFGNPDVKDIATVALVAVPIPAGATVGQRYNIGVRFPSATSDARQTPVNLTTFADRQIIITNISYVVGDSAIGRWYNAGDFGNGNLNNNDVNNAFLAAAGIFTPYPFTDVFDAMDAFPEDSAFAVGGDGQIRFLDWNVILDRSLRRSTNNWVRSWAAGGSRVTSSGVLNGLPNRPAEEISNNGPAWAADGSLNAATIENAKAGQGISVPVYANLKQNRSLKGLQFRVIVQPRDGASALTDRVQFIPNPNLPSPISLQGLESRLPLNQTVGAWSLTQNPFASALRNEGNLLGYVSFVVPAGAPEGGSYTIRFTNVDGSPDLRTQYALESLPGSVWVGGKARRAAEAISDEYKAKFFGSVDHRLAAPDADADDDGVSNLEEFKRGTSPTKLRFHDLRREWLADKEAFKLRWFGRKGETYRIERSSDLSRWTPIAENVAGAGDVQEVTDQPGGQAVFYRIRPQ